MVKTKNHTDSVCHVSQDCIMVRIDWCYSRTRFWGGYVFGPKRRSYQDNGKNCTIGSFTVCLLHKVLWLGSTNEERDGHVWDKKFIQIFAQKTWRSKPIEDLDIDEKIILKLVLNK